MPRELQKGLATKQPGIKYTPEDNGWPEPLNDESNQLRMAYTNGKSGSVQKKSVDKTVTDTSHPWGE